MNLIDLKKIETPRLLIRPVQLGDEVEISAAINRSLESLQRWMPWAKDPSFETTKKFVENAVKNRSTNSFRDFPLVAVHKGDHKIISATGFNEESEFDIGVYEIGYWIDVQYQGQGFVTEFVTAITRFAFEYLGAIRIQIATQIENEKSVSVAKRCGFSCEATMKNNRIDCKTGNPADSYLFSITNETFLPSIKMVVEENDVPLTKPVIEVSKIGIDLTQPLHPGIPDWDGCCGFLLKNSIEESSPILVQEISTPCGIGTHMDAPLHFIKTGSDISSIDIEKLVAPAVVIDVRDGVHENYFLQKSTLIDFEKQHGAIGDGMWVLLLTGWSQYWSFPEKYRNSDKNGCMHFPGFSEEAVDYLLAKNIVGIGIDTLSPDGSDMTFPVHHKILGAGKYIIENLCNLEKLPSVGAKIIALPMKIRGASEAPCRVIAEIL